MLRAVLFDLDGTFADTAPDLGTALNHVLALHHKPALPLSVTRLQASHGSAGLLKLGFGIPPESPEFPALRDAFLEHYTAHICDHTRLFPGMATLVETLEQRHIAWAIVTNKPHRFTVPLMQALGYADRAACLISGDTCARAKPYADPLLEACQRMGIPPANCLYLGDDLRDMQAANAAGMPGIIAAYGYVGPECSEESWQAQGSITTPTELLRYLPAQV